MSCEALVVQRRPRRSVSVVRCSAVSASSGVSVVVVLEPAAARVATRRCPSSPEVAISAAPTKPATQERGRRAAPRSRPIGIRRDDGRRGRSTWGTRRPSARLALGARATRAGWATSSPALAGPLGGSLASARRKTASTARGSAGSSATALGIVRVQVRERLGRGRVAANGRRPVRSSNATTPSA